MCRSVRDDSEMVRAGRDALGRWYLGRGVGRGVWWCREGHCEEGLRVTHLARALKSSVLASDVALLRGLSTSKRP
ncbi:MAG: hypothetical protein WAK12_04170 [Acidimicrobiales bacterium]